MPLIIPPSRDRLGESIVEAEAAGAVSGDTMRIVRLRLGAVALEVSQEVYDAWAGTHTDEAEPPHPPPSATDDDAPEAPDPEPGDPADADADAETDTDDPDGDATSSGTNRTRKRASGTTRRN